MAPASSLPMLLLLLLPLLALLTRTAPSSLARSLAQPGTQQAMALSVLTSAVSVLLAVLFGTPLAYALARHAFRGQRLLEVLVDMPMVLPPAVAGLALLVTFGRHGPVGSLLATLGVQVAFTPAAVVLAQTFVAAPLYIKTAFVTLAALNPELEHAAALDGAPFFQILRYVTLPLAWRGLIGGLALCWARAIGEFGATIIFAGNLPGRTQTMPLAVYLGLEVDFNRALALGAVMLLCSFAIMLSVRLLLSPGPDVS